MFKPEFVLPKPSFLLSPNSLLFCFFLLSFCVSLSLSLTSYFPPLYFSLPLSLIYSNSHWFLSPSPLPASTPSIPRAFFTLPLKPSQLTLSLLALPFRTPSKWQDIGNVGLSFLAVLWCNQPPTDPIRLPNLQSSSSSKDYRMFHLP